MAETSPSRRSSTPSSLIPQKRPLGPSDDDPPHAPAVSSPLNPDFAAARARKAAPPAREQREKKESLKKREAKGAVADNSTSARSGTPTDTQAHNNSSGSGGGGAGGGGGGGGRSASSKTKKGAEKFANPQALQRYTIPLPKRHDCEPSNPPVLVPSMTRAGRQFYESQEHVYNRKGFRYTHCIADPEFRFSNYHRQTETAPFEARFDYEDSSSHIRFDKPARSVSTEKGFRMARANVCIREGRWYWECKVLSGVKDPANPGPADSDTGGHVRMGISRREAPLETPVGFDAYSYGMRDLAGQKVHRSRPQDFFPKDESVCQGDVVGFEVRLPSLTLHKKVVDGMYNKAVDVGDELDSTGGDTPNIIRDRLPIRYKSQLYFEQFEYTAVKEVEELTHPPATAAIAATGAGSQAPGPNHPAVALRTLPFSMIKVYKNGKEMGVLYENLLAFLPLASKPAPSSGMVGAREGLDDGMLGYFPSLSVFQGGAAEANFGPNFWFPPAELSLSKTAGQRMIAASTSIGDDEDVDMIGANETNGTTAITANGTAAGSADSKRLRPLSERYDEQIAEDILYDIIDEVDLWMTEGGNLNTGTQINGGRGLLKSGVDTEAMVIDGIAAEDVGAESVGQNGVQQGTVPMAMAVDGNGELNEIVQDEE